MSQGGPPPGQFHHGPNHYEYEWEHPQNRGSNNLPPYPQEAGGPQYTHPNQVSYHSYQSQASTSSYYNNSPPPQSNYSHQSNRSLGQDSFQEPSSPTYDTDYTSGTPAESNRGVLGALGGGAAGMYGGRKVNHGILGTIGGAITGSMAENAYKKRQKKNSEALSRHEEQFRLQQQLQQTYAEQHQHFPPGRGPPPRTPSMPPQQQHQQQGVIHQPSHQGSSQRSMTGGGGGGGGGMGGAGPRELRGNFYPSSRNVRLERSVLVADCSDTYNQFRNSRLDLNDCLSNNGGRLEWMANGNFAATARQMYLSDGGRSLEAELGDGRGGYVWNKVWLDERVGNEDGRLYFVG